METKQKITAKVKSPSKDARLREGKGFSLNEIGKAGKSIELLKDLNIKIDFFRKSIHPENIELLNVLEIPKKKGKKREPFVKKEKKRTPFKSEVKKLTKLKAPLKKPIVKEKLKPIKKEKVVKKKIEKKEGKALELTDLSGLGEATAKKFIELGVNNIEDLVKENPEELATLIKGVSLERLVKWIEEAKSLVK
ncbi:MAG: helix-hairpin-helix domain-containing protein [Candidatus Thorarchaeota archaeon]